MPKSYKTTLCIPSLHRNEELKNCLRSIREGTIQPNQIIVSFDKGPLSKIRNEIARQSNSEILIFIDDDVEVSPKWLESILETFEREGCSGVSGPAIIRPELRANRDIFKYQLFKQLYDRIFLESRANLPGHFTPWGAWTTGASEESCNYSGQVQFLEACNMSFLRSDFIKASGFDEGYKGIGDWSEPDLCFKIRSFGGTLFFNPMVKVYHNVSKSGAYGLRLQDSKNRLENYFRFADRHLKQGWKLETYKLFLRTYYAFKAAQRYAYS